MTLRQTLILSEGVSQLCKYMYLVWFGLVWLDLLVVTVEKVFDLTWKKAYGINSEHSIRKH